MSLNYLSREDNDLNRGRGVQEKFDLETLAPLKNF